MKVLIVVPAFNEEKTLGKVIFDLREHGFKNILVIDDGSSDETHSVAKRKRVLLVSHIVNRGLGAALGTGFSVAKEKRFEILVTFDADRQHRAEDLKRLIDPIMKGKADVVIGSRLKDLGYMPPVRRILNLLSNLMTLLYYGVWTTDSQSGLRAFGRRAIENMEIKTDRMEVSSEFFREIKRLGLRFTEVPIKAIYSDYSLKHSKQERLGLLIPLRLLLRFFAK